jgi:hypothetical protein
MKQTQLKKKENEKEEVIKFAASLGINLTVLDRPSEKIYFPEKVEDAKKTLANIDLSFIKNR